MGGQVRGLVRTGPAGGRGRGVRAVGGARWIALRSAMTDDVTTRDKLLDAATRLFAERGIDNVSIAEIVRSAGQRNASALHYHFGTRNELLRELLAQHVPAIHDRRVELLARA